MKADPSKTGRRNPSGVRTSNTAAAGNRSSRSVPPVNVRPAGYKSMAQAEDAFKGGTRPARPSRANMSAAGRAAARTEGPKRSVPAKPAAKGKKGR